MIATGRYSDAYMLNRESNVFPGILGRTCDRPCEPACRRTRIDEKPVAICRLKRVAADLRDDITDRLPKAPAKKNGKKVACIGAGPASLTVANDLVPLGYEVVIFEKLAQAGGLMRSNIPAFRLPVKVLDEEIDMILNMGADIRYNTPVTSMKAFLDAGYDAVFVGTGAPKGKDLDIPGRQEAKANIHIGIDWLEAVAFGHIDKIGEKVLIIGVGNTAMDCCRTSRRLGGKDIKVMARRPRKYFKASEWELEDAEEELVEIVINYAPKSFVLENGRLKGMMFEKLEWKDEGGKQTSTVVETVFFPADDVVLAIGQENAFPWIERDIGFEFDKWGMPIVDKVTFQATRPGVFFGRRGVGAGEHHLGRRPRARSGDLDSQPLPRRAAHRAPRTRDEPPQSKDGDSPVELQQRLQPLQARQDAARRARRALQEAQHRGRARIRRRADSARGAALPQL